MASPFSGWLRRKLLGISPAEISLARRGFRAGRGGTRERLEMVPQLFALGYHAALEHGDLAVLEARLNAVEAEGRGFAFEGAAMALALLDCLTPWRRNRFRQFLAGPGAPHCYMVHVGAGWALARLRRDLARARALLDPLLGWLAIDGMGFHEGFFHWPQYLGGQPLPPRLHGYERRAFDQGLGRSLWFIEGADAGHLPRTISVFPAERRADLWSGVGLAAAYAGGVGPDELAQLRTAARDYWPAMAQGTAFAAKARQRAGILIPYTDLASKTLCGLPAAAAAQLTDDALKDLPPDGAQPAYEAWRQRIQARFAAVNS